MIRGHLQTRAVENVTTTISVNATSPFQTAPTMVFGKSGQCIKECVRNKTEILIYDFEKTINDFGENGRISISDSLIKQDIISIVYKQKDSFNEICLTVKNTSIQLGEKDV